MSPRLQEVLNRRSDLSTFVVHLTRDHGERDARANLERIIAEKNLIAGRPMGWAKAQDDSTDATKQSQRVVCFTETPLEHAYSMFAEIEDRERAVKLKPYGLAFTKIVARRIGVNPVWYVDMTPGRDWEIAHALDGLRDAAVNSGIFHTTNLAKVFPFIEQMGTWPNTAPKEFWWEREWRHRGSLNLTAVWRNIIWLCPEHERDDIAARVREATPAPYAEHVPVCIDPDWGLEQIVARLAGFPAEDVTLFHASAGDPDADLDPGF